MKVRLGGVWIPLFVLLVTVCALVGMNLSKTRAEDTTPSPEFIAAAMRDQEKPGMAVQITYDLQTSHVDKKTQQEVALAFERRYIRTLDFITTDERRTTNSPLVAFKSERIRTSFNRNTGEYREMTENYAGPWGRIEHTANNAPDFPAFGSLNMESVVWHFGSEPLYGIVQSGTVSGKEEVDGCDCWKIVKCYGKDNVQQRVICVDPKIGFCPRRMDLVIHGDVVHRIVLRDYKEVAPGVWFPTEQLGGTKLGDTPLTLTSYKVKDVKYYASPAAKELPVKFPSKTRVHLDDGSEMKVP